MIQVILMISLVVWLFVETQRAVNREREARQGVVTHTLWRERFTYALISAIFGLSYIGRIVVNDHAVQATKGDGPERSAFALYMT